MASIARKDQLIIFIVCFCAVCAAALSTEGKTSAIGIIGTLLHVSYKTDNLPPSRMSHTVHRQNLWFSSVSRVRIRVSVRIRLTFSFTGEKL